MDGQDGQDGFGEFRRAGQDVSHDRTLLHGKITKEIIGCAFDVMRELGPGFLEGVYERALVIALRQKGLDARAQQPVQVMFRGEPVGDYFADILVNGSVVVELKSVSALAGVHEAQVISYLNATGIEVGLLINFGRPRLDYRRLTRSKSHGDR